MYNVRVLCSQFETTLFDPFWRECQPRLWEMCRDVCGFESIQNLSKSGPSHLTTNCHSIIKLQIQALIPRGPACCEKWYDIALQPRVFWSWDPTNKLQTNQSRARFPEKNKNKNILLLVFAPASPTSSPPLWTIPPSSSCCRSRSSLLSPGCWWWSGLHGSRHRGHNGCHLKILQSISHQAILVHLLQEYAMCVFMIYTRILVPYTSTVYCKQYVYIIYIYILIVIYNVINVVM